MDAKLLLLIRLITETLIFDGTLFFPKEMLRFINLEHLLGIMAKFYMYFVLVQVKQKPSLTECIVYTNGCFWWSDM